MSYAKVSNNERRNAARRLRDAANGIAWKGNSFCAMLARLTRAKEATRRGVMYRLADLIEPKPVTGDTSDGFHTFDELYRHRAVLFSFIVTCFPGASWKSRRHHDGTMYDGMFIVGIKTPWGQATYHYDVDKCWDMFPCQELDRAPEWDGHTPDQAIERIERLAQRLADARGGGRAEIMSCWNVYDDIAYGSCDNGFECSVCGCKVEDEEHYHVSGTWNFCPQCGRKVVRHEH